MGDAEIGGDALLFHLLITRAVVDTRSRDLSPGRCLGCGSVQY